MFYGVPKSSPFIEEINREYGSFSLFTENFLKFSHCMEQCFSPYRALWFIDVGLRAYWYDKHDKQPEKCKLQYNSKGVSTKRSSKRIELQQFYLPFLILFIGYVLAFLQLCREKLFYRGSA